MILTLLILILIPIYFLFYPQNYFYLDFLALLYLTFKLVQQTLKICFQIELVNGFDAVFDISYDNAQTYIVSMNIFEGQVNLDKLKQDYLQLILENHKANRLKMLYKQFMGIRYFQQDPQFDINQHFIEFEQQIANEQQIFDFMAIESQNMFDKTKSEWCIFHFKNFKGNNSVFINKFNHVISDGMGLVVFQANLYDNDPSFIKIKGPNIIQYVMLYLSIPFQIFKIAAKRINSVNTEFLFDVKMSNQKQFSCLEQMDIKQQIKPISQKINISINMLIYLLINESLIEYIQNTDNNHCRSKIKNFRMMVPSSLRMFPQNKELLELKNDIFLVNIDNQMVGANSSLENKIKQYQQNMQEVYDYGYCFVNHYIVNLLYNLQYFEQFKSRIHKVIKRTSIGFSNVPATTNINIYQKKQIINQCFLMPSTVNMGLTISVLTNNNKMTVGVASDKAIQFQINRFKDIFYSKLQWLADHVKSGGLDQQCSLELMDQDQENTSMLRS